MKNINKMIVTAFTVLVFAMPVFSSEISTDKSDFDKVSNHIDDAVYDIRYYSSYNFTGARVRGYKAPVPYMTKEALTALEKAADILRKQGYRIIIWDTYRPQKAVDNFVEWMSNTTDEGNKSFYPNLEKKDLVSGGYVAVKSGHSRGSTIDLSIVKMDGTSVDMGGTFDLFSEVSHPDYKKISRKQKQNRKILRDAMEQAGFVGIDSEWWHFTLKDEPFKDTYFNFDVE